MIKFSKVIARAGYTAVVMSASLLFAASEAAADLIDFEDIVLAANSSRVDANYTSQGYFFQPAASSIALLQNGGGCGPLCAANGTKTLAAGGLGSNPPTVHPVNMTNVAGDSFILSGLDFAEFVQGGNSANATILHLVGNLMGGGTVFQDLAIDGVNDGPGGGVDFQSAVLSAFWSTATLSSLDFFGFDGQGARRGFQIDNINVRVPEPGTLALLGLGLVGMGLLRRRRKV